MSDTFTETDRLSTLDKNINVLLLSSLYLYTPPHRHQLLLYDENYTLRGVRRGFIDDRKRCTLKAITIFLLHFTQTCMPETIPAVRFFKALVLLI